MQHRFLSPTKRHQTLNCEQNNAISTIFSANQHNLVIFANNTTTNKTPTKHQQTKERHLTTTPTSASSFAFFNPQSLFSSFLFTRFQIRFQSSGGGIFTRSWRVATLEVSTFNNVNMPEASVSRETSNSKGVFTLNGIKIVFPIAARTHHLLQSEILSTCVKFGVFLGFSFPNSSRGGGQSCCCCCFGSSICFGSGFVWLGFLLFAS